MSTTKKKKKARIALFVRFPLPSLIEKYEKKKKNNKNNNNSNNDNDDDDDEILCGLERSVNREEK